MLLGALVGSCVLFCVGVIGLWKVGRGELDCPFTDWGWSEVVCVWGSMDRGWRVLVCW